MGNELHLGDTTDGVSNLLSAKRHGVSNGIVGGIHILSKKAFELGAREEPLASAITKRF